MLSRIMGGVFIAATMAASAVDGRAQSILCEDPSGFCNRQLSAECLSRVGAGAVKTTAGGDCESQFEAYRECLALVAGQCGAAADAPRPAPTQAATGARCDDAKAAFDYAKDIGSAEAFQDVSELCPDTFWGRQAAREAETLRAGAAPVAATRSITPPPAAQPTPGPAAPAAVGPTAAEIREAQGHLNRAGFPVGGVDGVWGARSERGLRAFQRRSGLPETGVLTALELAALRNAPTAPRPATGAPAPSASQTASGGGGRFCKAPITPSLITRAAARFTATYDDVHVAPRISASLRGNAIEAGNIPVGHDLLVIIDDNVFNTAERGMYLTNRGIFFATSSLSTGVYLGSWATFCGNRLTRSGGRDIGLNGRTINTSSQDEVFDVLSAIANGG